MAATTEKISLKPAHPTHVELHFLAGPAADTGMVGAPRPKPSSSTAKRYSVM